MVPPPAKFWTKGSELLEKAKHFYFGKEDKPMISERTALLCAVLFTLLYVAPFYLSSTLRTTPLHSRDSPTVIRARIRAVAISCLASTVISVYVLAVYGHAAPRDVLRLFAIWPSHPLDVLKTLALVATLFIGPLFETFVVDRAWQAVSFASIKQDLWDSLPGYRNYIIAPWCEELVFRSLVISLYLLAKTRPARIVFLTPLIFGVAHIHHLIEFVQARKPPGRLLPPAKVVLAGVVTSLFQFSYTSLFGFFAAFVYLRTGNVFASVAAHTFCNCMGLPRVWGRVGQHNDGSAQGMTPDVAQGKKDDGMDHVRVGNGVMNSSTEKQGPTGWRNTRTLSTVVYYLLLIAGAYGFYILLWPMTESTNALVTF